MSQRGWLWASGVVLLLALAFRIQVARGDLWLDEVWSLELAVADDARWGGMLRAHDNNHPLNSAWMAVLGKHRSPWLYRVPSLFFGTVAILAAGALVRRDGGAATFATVSLLASSSLVIHYSSEARGYAPSVAFGLLAWLALERHRDRPTWWTASAHAACASVSLLWHLTGAFLVLGLAGWSLAEAIRRRGPWRAGLMRWSVLHVLPLATLAWLATVLMHEDAVGGGPPTLLARVIMESAALTLGVSGPLFWLALGMLVFLTALLAGLHRLVKRHDTRAVIHATCIVIAPALALAFVRPESAAPRYFLACSVVFLMLVGRSLGELPARGTAGRALYALTLVVYLALNAWHVSALARFGRGQPSAVVEHALGKSGAGPVTVSSDHDFRNGMVFDYHASDRLRYVGLREWPPAGPDWYVVHRMGVLTEAPHGTLSSGPLTYRLEGVFRTSPLSGINYVLYRRADDAGLTEQ